MSLKMCGLDSCGRFRSRITKPIAPTTKISTKRQFLLDSLACRVLSSYIGVCN